MSRSRRKNWNVVNAASLARWLVLTVFLALTGHAAEEDEPGGRRRGRRGGRRGKDMERTAS